MRSRVVLAVLLLPLLAGKRAKGPPPTFLEDGPVVSANPLYPVTAGDQRLHALVYDPVFRPKRSGGGWTSDVLEAWSTGDDGRLEVLFKKGISWHDGEDADAADLCATLTALADEQTSAPLARLARRAPASCQVDAEEPRRAWVTLPVREPEPWRHLAIPLLPAHLVGGAVAYSDLSEPVGTGPYRAVRRDYGWWLEDARAAHRPAPVPVLERAWAPLAAARLGALRAGGAQAVVELGPADRAELSGESEYALRWYDRRRWTGILVDTSDGPLAEPSLRLAVDQALDREALRDEVGGVDPGRDDQPLTLLTGPGPYTAPSYNRGVLPTPPDPSAARQRVGEGVTLRLGVAPGLDHGPSLADAVVRQLVRVGMEVEVVAFTPEVWFTEVLSGERASEIDALLLTFDTDQDPDAWLHSRRDDRGVFQPFGSGHPAVDRALDDVRRAVDRDATRRELHAVLADTRALLPLWQTDAWTAWRSEIFEHHPLTPGDYFGAIERWTPRDQKAR